MSPAVRSPLPGEAAPLDSVDDPVFAGGVVGPGLALRPPTGGRLDVLAPVTGTIVKTTPHAFVVRADDGAAVLLVTHEPRFAAWADRTVFLRDGRTVGSSAAEDPSVLLTPFGDDATERP